MMSYRAPPSMPGIVRPPPPGPITPEYLVDRYMSQNSPRALGSHRKAPEPPSDPESWWKLYVLSTHVRGAATLQQSFRKEAWANSRLRSPRQPPGTPRSGGGMPPHSRSGRPAPQLPRHRTAAQAFAIAESFIPEVMEMYSLDLQQNKNQQNFPPPPKPGPPTMSRPGRPASPRVEGLAGHRAAPKMPGKRASTAELNHAQKLIVQKLTDRFSTLQRAFKTLDSNRSGAISRDELEAGLLTLNLESIPKHVIDTLYVLFDVDENGYFDFPEFCRVLTAPDVLQLAELKQKAEKENVDKVRKQAKAAAQKKKAAEVGMTVQEYCEYFDIPEIVV